MGRYSSSGIHLVEHGDLLVLHTEGLLSHGEGHYVPAQLERILDDFSALSAAEICERLRRDIESFAPVASNIELVVLKRDELQGEVPGPSAVASVKVPRSE